MAHILSRESPSNSKQGLQEKEELSGGYRPVSCVSQLFHHKVTVLHPDVCLRLELIDTFKVVLDRAT